MSPLVCPGALFPRGSFGHVLIFVRGCFCPGGLLSGGLMPVPPQVQCVYVPSRLSVRDGRTNKKKTKRQTRPRSAAGSRPPLTKFSVYVEVEAQYIFHPSTIWVRPLSTELGPKKTGDIINEVKNYVLMSVKEDGNQHR